MKRDCHGSVTRDMRVTSQVHVSRDKRDTSRVSHATTTPPHPTISVVTSVGGCCGDSQIQVQSVTRETQASDKALSVAAFGFGVRR